MLKIRVIPVLLLQDDGLVKTIQFQNPTYLGDPINAVRIFNTKEVDELILLDISATLKNKKIPFNLVSRVAEECFMPLTFGGGVKTLEDIKQLLGAGVEKVSINSAAIHNPSFIRQAAETFGSQSIIVSLDVKRHPGGTYEIFSEGANRPTGMDPVEFARRMEEYGAGEIFLNSIDLDGTMNGYDLELIKKISAGVSIPVVACGGAGRIEDFVRAAKEGGAAAAAAGSFFVFHGRRRAVLISFPMKKELEELFESNPCPVHSQTNPSKLI
ncbi:MAG TPA: AglZ/HisF2 family acetamidino modification protein [Candidatus Omnitrophota bacterium]|nr:AglZ/HisF2 family acetamidino modification protein [Candidatus Omnitrophota bacterium]